MALLVGFKTRVVAALLVGFSLVAAAIFDADFGYQTQQVMFLHNAAMAGGLLLLAKVGAPGFSADNLLAARGA